MFGVYSDAAGNTDVFIINPDGTTDSVSLTHAIPFVDSNQLIMCIGGRRTTDSLAQDVFTGMFNELRVYSDQLVLADLQALVSNACNAPCPICPATSAPACIEYVANAYIANWDFAQATYLTDVPDSGPNGLDFTLLDDQTSYDPIYVHNQGLYFDGTKHMRTTNTYTQNRQDSMTIEGIYFYF